MRLTKTLALTFGFLPGLVLPPASGREPRPAPGLTQIQAVLAQYPRRIQSLKSTALIETEIGDVYFSANQIPNGAVPTDQVSTEDWSFKTGKIYDHLVDRSPQNPALGQPPTIAHTWIYNGKSSYAIDVQKTNQGPLTYANLQHHFVGDPGWPPLSFGYKYDLQWIGDLLKSGAAIEGTVIDPIYGPLTIVRANRGDSTVRFWLAQKYGYVAVKTQAETPYKETTKVVTFEARGYHQYDHFWMPTMGQFTINNLHASKNTTIVTKIVHFNNITINRVPDSLFSFAFPPGAGLWDEDLGKKYIMDPSGKWVELTGFNKRNMHAATPAATRINVAAWLFTVTLLTTLIGGIFVWRRGLRSS